MLTSKNRSAGDDKVREEHAALHNTTLPMDDDFWNEYYPPLGWNCRCTVVQVRKDKYPESDSSQAIAAGERATAKPKQKIFRFNPGKTMKVFPPKHPYLPKGCGNCPFNKSGKLASNLESTNCENCNKSPFQNDKYDVTKKLDELHKLNGSDYNKKLEEICSLKVFKPMPKMKDVYWVGNIKDSDLEKLKDAASKAVVHKNKVFILPNPGSTRSADFIFERKGIYKHYDLKSITGQNSVSNRLEESKEQTKRVLLNMKTTYNPRQLAEEIQTYFYGYDKAVEVLIYKENREISINRLLVNSKRFINDFIKLWAKQKR